MTTKLSVFLCGDKFYIEKYIFILLTCILIKSNLNLGSGFALFCLGPALETVSQCSAGNSSRDERGFLLHRLKGLQRTSYVFFPTINNGGNKTPHLYVCVFVPQFWYGIGCHY